MSEREREREKQKKKEREIDKKRGGRGYEVRRLQVRIFILE